MPITDAAIRAIKPEDKPRRVFDGGGLYLEVSPNGAKRWFLKYRITGKEKRLALGVYPAVGLKEARAKRDAAKKQVEEGIDPLAQRKVNKLTAKVSAANTFESVALEWMEGQRSDWTEAHAERVRASMNRHLFPSLGKLPIDSIKPLALLEVLRVVERAGKLETAKRLRERCSGVFKLAIITGRCESDPSAALAAAMKPPVVSPRKAMTRDQLPIFLNALHGEDCTAQTRLLMELVLHCFTRIGETVQARWEHIDFDAALWTIPVENRKLTTAQKRNPNTVPHLVPLSIQSLDMLRRLQSINGGRAHVFPNRNRPDDHMSPESARRLLERMGYRGKADVHGFRSTASTILNETGLFHPDAIERQLSHVEGNAVRRAYDRSEHMEARVAMLQWWSNYLDAARDGRELPPMDAGKVVPFLVRVA